MIWKKEMLTGLGWNSLSLRGMDGPIYQLLSLQVGAWSKLMNESIDWKSVVPFTVKDPEKGILVRVCCVQTPAHVTGCPAD